MGAERDHETEQLEAGECFTGDDCAEERSFTRAAERCHVVQSALSHQIKALERELRTSLFAHTSRRVEDPGP